MKLSAKSGATIAAAAAALVISGAAMGPMAIAGDKAEAKVACYGVNSCKGTGACKTAKNACKGQNSCKGTGFELKTKAECAAAKGKLTES